MIDRLCAEALARGGKLLYQWLTQSIEGLNRPLMHADAVPGISSAARHRVAGQQSETKADASFPQEAAAARTEASWWFPLSVKGYTSFS